MRMPFKDYVELLYRAYLEDEEILQRLREKLQDTDCLKRLDGDPEFQDWDQVNPRDIDPRKQSKSKYHPHPLDLQQGVRVFESSKHKAVNKVREIIKRRQTNELKNHQQNFRKQSEADPL